MKHLSQEDLTKLKEHKELRARLRTTLKEQSKGRQKCSIGLFQKEATRLGIHLSDDDYKVMWNAFKVKKKGERDAGQILILVQNEMNCDDDCDINFENAIKHLAP